MARRTDRVRTRSRDLDKFYARPEVAARCVAEALAAIAPLNGTALFVEPAADGGVFLDALPEPKIGLDIEPDAKRSDITKADFLS